MNKLKTILVGESQVGKTSIITQYIRQSFDEEYLPTISADKSIKDLIIVKLQIVRINIYYFLIIVGYSWSRKI